METRPFSTSLRRQRAVTLLVLLTLLGAGLSFRQFPVHAATDTLTWSLPPRNLTSDVSKAFNPRIVADTANHYHIIFGTTSHLYYINNVSGSFSKPQSIADNLGGNRDRFFDIALGPDGSLHVVYSQLGGDTKHGYYTKGTLNGATATWSTAQEVTNIPGNSKGYMSSVAVDSSGNAHMVWFDDSKDTYNVAYRVRFANGSLGATSYPHIESKSENLEKSPQIVLTNDNKVHIVFTRGIDLLYARLDGSTWTVQKLSAKRSFNPGFATDGTNLYVNWDSNGISFRRSQDGGNSWSNTIVIASGDSDNTYAEAAWAAASRRVYLAWSDDIGADENIYDIWYREFDPSDGTTTNARQLSDTDDKSTWPEISAGPTEVALTWQEGSDIDLTRSPLVVGPTPIPPSPTPSPNACTGTLVLEDGQTLTRNSIVSGIVTPSADCAPDQMQVSVDTPPSASSDKITYSSSISATIPSGGCSHTVYVQLYKDGSTGVVVQASIKVKSDTSVNALVQAINPHTDQISNYVTPNIADIAPQDGSPGGASNGATGYTRDRSMVLNVNGASNCADVTSFAVTGSISDTIANSLYINAIPLPGNASTGTKQFTVTLTDALSDTQTFSSSIIYDPASTSSSTTLANTSGLPILDTTSVSATLTGPSTANSIVVPLNFSNISVSDNIYGRAEGLGTGKQFWGVWVANSRSDNDINNSDLDWIPMPVANPDSSFTINWSLFNGLSQTRDAGDYYVYVRFLDGAGNPSQGYLKTKVTLASGYSMFTTYLPLTDR